MANPSLGPTALAAADCADCPVLLCENGSTPSVGLVVTAHTVAEARREPSRTVLAGWVGVPAETLNDLDERRVTFKQILYDVKVY